MFKIVTPEREGYVLLYLSPANIAYGVVCQPFLQIGTFYSKLSNVCLFWSCCGLEKLKSLPGYTEVG